ncbi:MAG: 4-hydroxythreonine-4-phosphate dehydrogenase PdxA [Candidatus Delongbacteria bacterium]|nr:4-hydroxythreonine-4-phosphate dehydrogenase PdxA [bacterium]MBL7033246.1 4-hydroxythreonine-4-phosphate dehydrogenase PdxA [Candidatus Delongbacteria bacterium]
MSTNSDPSPPRRLCLTCGDPAGVGPELVAAALPHLLARGWQPLVIMPAPLLESAQQLTGLFTPFQVAPPEDRVATGQAQLWFPDQNPPDVNQGEISLEAGLIAYQSLETAVRLVQAEPQVPLVTAPVNKQALHLAGFRFPGQTDFLGARDNNRKTRMIMYHVDITIALATIHLPLQEVSDHLGITVVQEAISDLHNFLKRLGRVEPIRVLALNPHAGEGGLFGKEEQSIITPAIAQAQAAGLTVRGPVCADTAFNEGGCFVAMYHDQAMIPFKLIAGWQGVNVTWGLSFIRTSPDHGTAFPLAWSNRVDPASMLAAIDLALRLAL